MTSTELRSPIGTRVRATLAVAELPEDTDQRGVIERSEMVQIGDDAYATPAIRLDDGRLWFGYECWWMVDDKWPTDYGPGLSLDPDAVAKVLADAEAIPHD